MAKIVYFSCSKVPSQTANSVHIMKMCNAFAKEGHMVTLFAYIEGKASINHIMEYYNVKHRFTIINLRPYLFPFTGVINGILMSLLSLKIKPDILMGRDLKACYFATLFNQKVYFETHEPMTVSGKINHFIFRQLIKHKNFQKLILITNTLKEYYCEKYPHISDKILVIPDGADQVDFDTIKVINIKKAGKLNIDYTGHLYAGKGMEIISELVPLCPYAHFHVVGGRDDELKQWGYLSNYDNVTFYGHVDHSDVKNYIAQFDVVLLPNQRMVRSSIGRDIGRWTSPLKLFEYMAMEKPIICSNLEVLREVVIHHRNAILCDPDNIQEWLDAIELLVGNPQLALEIGKGARTDFEKNYTWTERANKIVNDCLDNKKEMHISH